MSINIIGHEIPILYNSPTQYVIYETGKKISIIFGQLAEITLSRKTFDNITETNILSSGKIINHKINSEFVTDEYKKQLPDLERELVSQNII